ncbi:ABC transporter [Natronolimnohabitans innermongolicus JCM 12255]|uniref:ABC transporter n=2 Tax=Natronolimnohabitans innermongolicus TaxID=253107 RepID=L9X6L0_9EURY|nr:ABC transporter [Natronolimnohabitans innermongolicus JCM 12255]
MLTTLVRPTAGTARIMGTDVTNRNEVIRHIGYLPDKLPLFEELTAREQLGYLAALNDIPRAVATERAEAYLERFDLVEKADHRIGTYSKGMRQKLGIIQTLLKEPPVLLLDEPTSGLDPRAARTVKDIIAELADGDTTIFLTTHILSVVDELADTVGVIHNGRLVTEGPIERLKRRAESGDERTLEEVFLSVTADHASEWERTETDVSDAAEP